jgi:hypothetical protein
VEIINDGFCVTFESDTAFWPTAHEFNYDNTGNELPVDMNVKCIGINCYID